MYDRNRLILDHYSQVKSIASRMHRRFPANVELDDLVNVGLLGLIDAVDRFDPSRGVPFRPYADMRIKGSIVDWLRAEDFVPRPTRDLQHEHDRTMQDQIKKLGRQPTREEMAFAMGVTPERYDHIRNRTNIGRLVNASQQEPEQSASLMDQLPSHDALPDVIWADVERRHKVLKAIERLPEREQQVVLRYDIQGGTLRDIADELGITESRVSQIRTGALKRLGIWLRDVMQEV